MARPPGGAEPAGQARPRRQLRAGRPRGAVGGNAPPGQRVQGGARAAGNDPGTQHPDEGEPAMSRAVGQQVLRVDGRAKVTGTARYSAEIPLPDLAHGELVGAAVASGRIPSIDTTQAERADG